MKKHTKVKTYRISEIRAALNDLIAIFETKGDEQEIRKIVVNKEGKLEVEYNKEE